MNNNKFDHEYYATRYKKGIFSERGDKPFFYAYWIKFLTKKYTYPIKPRLLDYGCGEGFWLKRISPFTMPYGTETSKYAVEVTKTKVKHAEIKQVEGENIPFDNDFFDIITCWDVIEHLENPEKFVSEIFRVLRSKGIVIISTPNLSSWGRTIRKKNWHGNMDKTHISMKNIDEWLKIFIKNNFRVIKYGTDLFWDIPYIKIVPRFIQKTIFVGINNLVFFLIGFTPFKHGENAYFILEKKEF
ncbi:MAG: class I SAM-dependent methyltransferase [Spirochaetes bacterium]|nr:class I SAM-dependent methyltransferase [Spirochaetota bacterium]